MSMSPLSGWQSLRDIPSNLDAQQHKFSHLGAKPIPRSTPARRNEQPPAERYERVFYRQLAQSKQVSGEHTCRVKNPVYSLDTSALDLALNLFPWAAHREDTATVTLSAGLNHGMQVPEFVAIRDGQENDRVQGRRVDVPKRRMVAFDKEYVDDEWFKSLTDEGVFFVTRLRAKAVYAVKERRPVH